MLVQANNFFGLTRMTRQTITAIKRLQERVEAIEARIGHNGGPPLDDPPDSLVPDPVVEEEFGVGPMTIHRWDQDEKMAALGWPPPTYIRKRKYRSRKKLETFKAALVRRSSTRPRRRHAPPLGADDDL
jgi:hypothetical protein